MRFGPGQVIQAFGAPAGASTGTWCGGINVAKQMLTYLGYYQGPLDGRWDQDADQALLTFSLAEGLRFTSGGVLYPEQCERLIARYDAKLGGSLKSQMVRVAREEPATVDAARMKCTVSGGVWDPASRTCAEPARTMEGGVPPEMAAAQACAEAGGVWHTDMRTCYYPESAPPAGWWDRQSTGVKMAVIGGGVLVAGGVLYAVMR